MSMPQKDLEIKSLQIDQSCLVNTFNPNMSMYVFLVYLYYYIKDKDKTH